MKIKYRNKNTGEIREYNKPNKPLEQSKNWVRVGLRDKLFRVFTTKGRIIK